MTEHRVFFVDHVAMTVAGDVCREAANKLRKSMDRVLDARDVVAVGEPEFRIESGEDEFRVVFTQKIEPRQPFDEAGRSIPVARPSLKFPGVPIEDPHVGPLGVERCLALVGPGGAHVFVDGVCARPHPQRERVLDLAAGTVQHGYRLRNQWPESWWVGPDVLDAVGMTQEAFCAEAIKRAKAAQEQLEASERELFGAKTGCRACGGRIPATMIYFCADPACIAKRNEPAGEALQATFKEAADSSLPRPAAGHVFAWACEHPPDRLRLHEDGFKATCEACGVTVQFPKDGTLNEATVTKKCSHPLETVKPIIEPGVDFNTDGECGLCGKRVRIFMEGGAPHHAVAIDREP